MPNRQVLDNFEKKENQSMIIEMKIVSCHCLVVLCPKEISNCGSDKWRIVMILGEFSLQKIEIFRQMIVFS